MALYSVHEPYSNFNMVVLAKRSLLTVLVGTRLNVLQYIVIMRFLTHYVDVTKCLLDIQRNPNQTVLNEIPRLQGTHYVHVTKCLLHSFTQNISRTLTVLSKVLRLKGTPCDVYAKRLETHFAVALHMFDRVTLLKKCARLGANE